MKKLLTLILTVALVLSLGSILFAGADFVPSVESDDAPVILTPSVPAEELPDDYDPADEIKAIITDAEGNKTYVPESKLGVISLSAAYSIVDKGTYDDETVALGNKLIAAYDDIQASLTEAVTGLEDFAAELGFTAPEFTVKNVFEIGNGLDLSADGTKVDIIFGNNMDVVDGGFVVAYYVDDAWVIVDADKVVFDDNNDIHVEFDSLCPVVFIAVEETAEETTVGDVETEETTVDDETTVGDDVEPKPSNNSWIWIVIVVAVVAAAGVTVYVLYKKGVFSK